MKVRLIISFKEQYSKNFLKANYNNDGVELVTQPFKEQYSKNFLKANYNSTYFVIIFGKIQRTILKELFESKLQQGREKPKTN